MCVETNYLDTPICRSCRRLLERFSYDGHIDISGSKVQVGFHYRSIVRTLVLRAKVKNEASAAAALTAALRERLCHSLALFNQPSCLVLSAPSSLRSRLGGRFDLASLVCAESFPRASRLAQLFPGSFWRIKRAGRNRDAWAAKANVLLPEWLNFLKTGMISSKKSHFYDDFQRKVSSAVSILVVDDVLTTGLTMGTLFHQLKTLGAQRIEGLVLAAADQL